MGNVVATLGTALTDRHVRVLSRFAREVVLVFDSDTAGQAAAERALEMFLAQQLHVRVATLPGGKDPCEYCLTEGADALKTLIAEAPDALQYIWEQRSGQWESAGKNLAERRRFVEEFLNLVVSSAAYGAIDEIRRGQLAQHIAHLLNVPAADLQQQMRRLGRRITRSSRKREDEDAGQGAGDPSDLAQREVLEVLVNQGELFDLAAEQLDLADFTNEQYRRIASVLWTVGKDGRINLDELLASEELSGAGPLLTDLANCGQRRGNHEQTLGDAVEHLLYLRQRQELEDIRSGEQ
ncbi:MAG: toprim domain-containing protein, partial [Planctomycetota bacterium]